MYRTLKSPLAVQLELTTKCNHRCIHCYNHWRKGTAKDRALNENEIRKIIGNLKESEVPNFLITGGEPMLYPDLMFKAFELGKEAGLKCSLNSNLTLVTPKIAEGLRDAGIGVLTSILSFDRVLHDSITMSEGSFDRLVEGIQLLHRYGVPIGANMVVMQLNADQIYETGKFVHNLGVSSFRATKVHPAQGSPCFESIKLPPEKIARIFDDLIRLEKDFNLKVDSLTTYPLCLLRDLERYGQFLLKRSCSAGKTGCTIGADGQVRPCGHSDDNYGNTIEESLLTIWPRLKEWRDGSLLPSECKECKYIVQCSGGCRMDCKFYGKVDSMDPYATGKDFELIPRKSEGDTIHIASDTKLVVNPKLYLRKEQFGSVMVVDGDFRSIITPDSARLLDELRGTEFTLDNILDRYNLKEDAVRNFFLSLYKQNVVCLAKIGP